MCGIAGSFALRRGLPPPSLEDVRAMVGSLRHRGPDEFGLYRDARVALGHARLSIIDLATGQQPLSNEDGTKWVVFNGEIFNYLELREELESKHGRRFATRSAVRCRVPVSLEGMVGSGISWTFAYASFVIRWSKIFVALVLLFFAALYHDVNKPQTKTIEESGRIRFLGHDDLGAQTALKRGMALHLSNDELDRLKLIIRHHMRIHAHSSRKEAEQEENQECHLDGSVAIPAQFFVAYEF